VRVGRDLRCHALCAFLGSAGPAAGRAEMG